MMATYLLDLTVLINFLNSIFLIKSVFSADVSLPYFMLHSGMKNTFFIVLTLFFRKKNNHSQSNFPSAEISFEEIDSSERLTDEERAKLYAELAKFPTVAGMCAAIRDWLQKLDEERANLQRDDFLESL